MRRTLFLLMALSSVTVAHSSETHTSIPKEFVGEWSAEPTKCSIDDQDNLAIYPNHVEFYESSGPAIAIATKNSELALILELSGEGEEWLSLVHFRLSPDGKALTDISDPYSEEQLVRHKCQNK